MSVDCESDVRPGHCRRLRTAGLLLHLEHARREGGPAFTLTYPLPRKSGYKLSDARGIRLNRAFPDAQDEPTLLLQNSIVEAISLSIRGDLRKPVGAVAATRQLRLPGTPVVAVPEVAVAEQCDPRACQDNVRATR